MGQWYYLSFSQLTDLNFTPVVPSFLFATGVVSESNFSSHVVPFIIIVKEITFEVHKHFFNSLELTAI